MKKICLDLKRERGGGTSPVVKYKEFPKLFFSTQFLFDVNNFDPVFSRTCTFFHEHSYSLTQFITNHMKLKFGALKNTF